MWIFKSRLHQLALLIVGVLLLPQLVIGEYISHTYDDLNRLVRTDYGNGTVIEYAYDAAGNRSTQTVTEPHPPPPPPNVPPSANGGPDQVVRLNSLVTLDGSASIDPDNGPEPLSYRWLQMTGATLTLTGDHTSNLTFTPGQEGVYSVALFVSDGAMESPPDWVFITVPKLGDLDQDGDVDNADLNSLMTARNTPANGPNDLRDLNGDLKIDALDARKLTLLCTRPRCATQ